MSWGQGEKLKETHTHTRDGVERFTDFRSHSEDGEERRRTRHSESTVGILYFLFARQKQLRNGDENPSMAFLFSLWSPGENCQELLHRVVQWHSFNCRWKCRQR